MNRQRGLTLIELVTTLAVAAILVNTGAFAYRSLIAGGARDGAARTLTSAFNFARSEAIKRSSVVAVCPAPSGSDACSPSLSDADSAARWAGAWLVFVNQDGDFPPTLDSGETVLRRFDNRATSYDSNADATITRGVNLLAHGIPTRNGAVRFCDSDGQRASALVTLSPLGIAEVSYDSDTRNCGS